jgi:hypothetical protein
MTMCQGDLVWSTGEQQHIHLPSRVDPALDRKWPAQAPRPFL